MAERQRISRIGGKFYQTNTTNKSFLQVAADLKMRGVKNYYFFLEIMDPYLVDVDVYSPNITRDQISRVMIECAKNPWYYLREVARIPSSGGIPVQYKANRGNVAQSWCLLTGIDSWLCLPRQQGKTESILALITWAYSFGTNDSTFIFVNKDNGNAKANLQRVKAQIDCLPPYLRFDQLFEEDNDGKLHVTKAVKNATTMKHPVTRNQIITKPAATSYEKALSIARGLTSPLLHFDEPEFTKYIKVIVENSVSTYETASRAAKANGALYGRCFTCTPGDLDTSAGQDSQQLLSKSVKWTEEMYNMYYNPKTPNELEDYIKYNGTNGIVYIEYSYKQLGLGEDWAHKMFNLIGNPLTFKREILLQRLRGSSDSPFDQEDIEYIVAAIHPILSELYILDHFRFDIYEELDRNIPYIVGIDCSTGTNEDNNAITIVNPYTVKPVAEFVCPYIGETMYEKLIIDLVKKHIPRAIVCIERNSVGDGIIDHLLSSSIMQNLYFDKSMDLVENNLKQATNAESMLKKQGERKKFYGVYTSTKSREDMMAILMRRMAEYKDDFITKNVIDDISRLVRTSSGKIVAGPGYHDDSIMSYLIALYVYYHGNNLQAFGFVKGAKEIENQNKGLSYTFDDIRSSDLIPQRDIDIMQMQEQVRQENDYETIMRNALLQAQQESARLHQKGLVINSTLKDTPIETLDDELYGNFDLGLFDDLNNF